MVKKWLVALGCQLAFGLSLPLAHYPLYSIIIIGMQASPVPTKTILPTQGTPTLAGSLSSPPWITQTHHPDNSSCLIGLYPLPPNCSCQDHRLEVLAASHELQPSLTSWLLLLCFSSSSLCLCLFFSLAPLFAVL